MRRGTRLKRGQTTPFFQDRFVPIFHRTVHLHQFPVRGVHVVVQRHVGGSQGRRGGLPVLPSRSQEMVLYGEESFAAAVPQPSPDLTRLPGKKLSMLRS